MIAKKPTIVIYTHRADEALLKQVCAGIEEEGKRSFKIYRAKPDGKSYARDIANRYGLTYENIVRKIDAKR